jgi:hypothetical protein
MAQHERRHGCLAVWLIAMMVMSVFGALVYFLAEGFLREAMPGASGPLLTGLGALAVLNIGFAIALWNWKKWGFWGYCATSFSAFIINLLMGTGLGASLWGLMGVAILYSVLQIGGERRGWPQLE